MHLSVAEIMTRYINFDKPKFSLLFNRRPFQVSHALMEHSLFYMDELMSLANRLPVSSIEYNAGNVPVSLDPAYTPQTGLTVSETIRCIRDFNSWLVIKNVEQDPAYGNLLESCLAEAREFAGIDYSAMHDKHGFIFISSPGAVTPFHMDPEHNFLFQIRGWKTITVFDQDDRNVLSDKDLERFFMGGHRNLELKKVHESKGHVYQLRAGDGLHIPVTSPHWVKNGDDVSISFSITFQSAEIEHRSHIYKVNAILRKAGCAPTAPGVSVLRDALKLWIFNILRGVKRMLRFPIRIWTS